MKSVELNSDLFYPLWHKKIAIINPKVFFPFFYTTMSIPNDLEFASTFAQQDIPVPAPVAVKVEQKVVLVKPEEVEVSYFELSRVTFAKNYG